MTTNWFTRNASSILTGLGVLGSFGAAGLAIYDTVKAVHFIEDKEAEEGRKFTRKEKLKIAWPRFVPTALCLAGASACTIAGQGLTVAQLASLGAGVGYLAKNREVLKGKVEEFVKQLPPEKQEDSMSTVFRDIYQGVVAPTWERTGKGTVKFIDIFSGRTFLSSPKEVEKAIGRFNERWHSGESLSMSDWYDELSIMRTTFGYMFGFCNDPAYYDEKDIVINMWYNEKEGTYYIDFSTEPMPDWSDKSREALRYKQELGFMGGVTKYA